MVDFGFEALTAVNVKKTVFWIVTSCSSEGARGIEHMATFSSLLPLFTGSFLGLRFDSEEGGGIFLSNVG
jgi:hypothetical protein